MAKESVGDREVVYAHTFLMKAGQDARCEVNAGNWLLRMRFVFVETRPKPAVPTGSVSIKQIKDYIEVTLENWEHFPQIAHVDPIHFGTRQDGVKVWFTGASQVLGASRKLDVQILMGGAE